MKKGLSFLLALLFTLTLTACGGKADDNAAQEEEKTALTVDVDLTALSATMVYSEVYNMMSHPDDYVGKRILMRGLLDVYEGAEDTYFACVIPDATACCAQGLEFVAKDGYTYPDDYPQAGQEVTVRGTVAVMDEGQYRFIRIVDADLVQS